MRNKKGLFLIWLFVVASFAIGFRSIDVGTDTAQYVRHFNNSITKNDLVDNFEVGFSFFMYISGKITNDYRIFFSLVSLVISLTYLYLFSKIYFVNYSSDHLKFVDIGIFCFLMFISSWYFAFTTNGLRQGIALPLLYLGLYYLIFQKKWIIFIIYLCFSVLFHISGLLVLPFVFLANSKRSFLWLIWTLLLLGYYFGINESLIKFLSDSTGLPLHKLIKYYAVVRGEDPDSSLYFGFNNKFVLYTAFWPLFGEIVILVKRKYHLKDYVLLENIIKLYILCNMSYFLFGFGGFSNRYAAISWFFIPILQFGIFKYSNFKFVSVYLWLFLALTAYLYFVLIKLSYV